MRECSPYSRIFSILGTIRGQGTLYILIVLWPLAAPATSINLVDSDLISLTLLVKLVTAILIMVTIELGFLIDLVDQSLKSIMSYPLLSDSKYYFLHSIIPIRPHHHCYQNHLPFVRRLCSQFLAFLQRDLHKD